MTRAPSRPWGFAGWRWELLGAVTGRTLEIGCGWGRNFRHYPDPAAVTAFDVNRLRLAEAAALGSSVHLAEADAEHLSWDSRSFDSVAGTLVFCSIPQPAAALAEARRVLRPGGRLYLVEHVRSHHGWLAQAQDWLAPAWLWGSGGCHLNRDTEAAVRSAGFEIERLKIGFGGLLKLMVARPR